MNPEFWRKYVNPQCDDMNINLLDSGVIKPSLMKPEVFRSELLSLRERYLIAIY